MEFLKEIRDKLNAVEQHLLAGAHEEAHKVMMTIGVHFGEMYDHIRAAIKGKATVAALAQGEAKKTEDEIEVFVTQMLTEIHSGVQNAEQAAARLTHKSGMDATKAMDVIRSRLLLLEQSKAATALSRVVRPQADIDEENARTGVLESRIEAAAAAAHAAVNAFRVKIGEATQEDWSKLSNELQQSSIMGVKFLLENPEASPEEQHDAWLAYKLQHGWSRGETYSATEKTSPFLVPWDELPQDQKDKGMAFRDAVQSAIAANPIPAAVGALGIAPTVQSGVAGTQDA